MKSRLRAFTLTEVVLTLAIILTVAGIGSVTWGALTSGASNKAASQKLTTLAGEIRIYEMNRGSFPTGALEDAVIAEISPKSVVVDTAVRNGEVSYASNSVRAGFALLSESGDCLTISVGARDSDDTSTKYGVYSGYPCTGELALTATGDSW